MRLFIATLGTETNTFSPLPTGRQTFEETLCLREASRRSTHFAAVPVATWRRLGEADGHTIVESLSAFAQPGGPTVRTVYEQVRDEIVAELVEIRHQRKLFFFVDDNFAGNIPAARELAEAIAPLGVRGVTQMSVDAAHNEDFVETLARSGCRGVLIGFESLDKATLRKMGKKFNTMGGGYGKALGNLRRHGIRVYGTFIFGYGTETEQTFRDLLLPTGWVDVKVAAIDDTWSGLKFVLRKELRGGP